MEKKEEFERDEFRDNLRKTMAVKLFKSGLLGSKWVDVKVVFDNDVLIIPSSKDDKEGDIVFLYGAEYLTARDSDKTVCIENALHHRYYLQVEDHFAAKKLQEDINRRGAHQAHGSHDCGTKTFPCRKADEIATYKEQQQMYRKSSKENPHQAAWAAESPITGYDPRTKHDLKQFRGIPYQFCIWSSDQPPKDMSSFHVKHIGHVVFSQKVVEPGEEKPCSKFSTTEDIHFAALFAQPVCRYPLFPAVAGSRGVNYPHVKLYFHMIVDGNPIENEADGWGKKCWLVNSYGAGFAWSGGFKRGDLLRHWRGTLRKNDKAERSDRDRMVDGFDLLCWQLPDGEHKCTLVVELADELHKWRTPIARGDFVYVHDSAQFTKMIESRMPSVPKHAWCDPNMPWASIVKELNARMEFPEGYIAMGTAYKSFDYGEDFAGHDKLVVHFNEVKAVPAMVRYRWFLVWFLSPTEKKWLKPLSEYTIELYAVRSEKTKGGWSPLGQIQFWQTWRTSEKKVQEWAKANKKTLPA